MAPEPLRALLETFDIFLENGYWDRLVEEMDEDGDGQIDVGEFIGRFVPVAGATVYAAVADMKARMAEFEGRENYLPTAAFGGRRVGYVFRTRYLGVGCGLAEGGAVAPCRATRRSVGNRSW